MISKKRKNKQTSDEQLIELQAPTNVEAKAISPNEIAIQWTDPNIDIYYNHPSETIKSLFRKRKYVIKYVIHIIFGNFQTIIYYLQN